jgi:hypothetical protein
LLFLLVLAKAVSTKKSWFSGLKFFFRKFEIIEEIVSRYLNLTSCAKDLLTQIKSFLRNERENK